MDNKIRKEPPIDRVRFFNARLACEAFSATNPPRVKEDVWDAVVTYSDGRNEYYAIGAPNKKECANGLRRKGIV